MFRSHALKSLSSAAIDANENQQEHIEANGLVLGHAYGILDIAEIIHNDGSFSLLRSNDALTLSVSKSLKLIRLRNPWV